MTTLTGPGRSVRTRTLRVRTAGLPFVAPTWLFMVSAGLIPIGYAVWMSLSDQSLGGAGGFIGLDNYLRAVFTPNFLSSLGVTLLFVVAGLIVQFALG